MMKKIFFLFFFISFNLIHSQVESETTHEDDNILITIIEDIPLAPGCESVDKNKRMECFNVFMTEHIKKHFKYPNAAARKNIQGKVFVTFLIDKEGFVEKIETKGGHALLRKEAFRIIDKLPKFIPGYQKGKPVKVRYGLPITFRLTK